MTKSEKMGQFKLQQEIGLRLIGVSMDEFLEYAGDGKKLSRGLTLKKAAKYLGLEGDECWRTVGRMCDERQIPFFRARGRKLIDRVDLDNFIEAGKMRKARKRTVSKKGSG